MWWIAPLTASVLTLLTLELMIGSVMLHVRDVMNAVWVKAETGPAAIVWELRLPRAVTAMLAGSALSVSGLILQTLLRNPLAGPWALGLTAGAQIGVALVVTSGAVIGSSLLTSLSPLADLSLISGAAVEVTHDWDVFRTHSTVQRPPLTIRPSEPAIR